MTTDTDWKCARDEAMARTVAELVEIGQRMIVPHGATLAEWRRERDERILKALRAWPRSELSFATIAGHVGCTTERVRQIGAENGL